ncbi:hypothetical protein OMP43_17765 [Sphingomonas sp. CBMAI 2297]|uniref:hypothetical protein n=1 Tax=Sphingomonas sp. CBMAI 2297 TaxID=2991720 RepID=UPI002453766F|nr:hypothetical protein [Sphingomonas sp. CBMAI 2297]MDH4745876.1 hypothetical protein [Sphingomonas sp. CBMAI 2297]
MASLFDQITGVLGDAIADIRHRLVEEGWFGRSITPEQPERPIDSFYRPVMAEEADPFETLWGAREHGHDPAPEREPPCASHGIDL